MGVCGYAVAALDARELAKKTDVAWLPAMREKYLAPEKKECFSPAEVNFIPLFASFFFFRGGISEYT